MACACVNKHIPFPVEPDRGDNTVPANDAVTTGTYKFADGAYDAEIAYDAVYKEPDPNGYTDIILNSPMRIRVQMHL
jgi:hypothetical protein